MENQIFWAGIAPEHWNIIKEKHVLQHHNRKVEPEDEIVTAFRDGQVTLRANRRTEGFTMSLKEIGYHHVCVGDLVVHSMDGGFGAIGVSDSDGKASPVVHTYTSNVADLHFVAHQLRTAAAFGWIAANGKGIRVRSTQFDRVLLDELELALPSLQTQRAIADYLDRETAEIDAMMADLEKMETLLTERRDATVEKLLLGGGTPELEGLPEGWTRTTLGTVFSFHNGDRGVHYPRPEEIKDEGIPFINAGDLINGSVDLEGCKRVSPEKYAQMGGAKLQRGDILFCLRGSLGKWGLMESDGGSLASSLCALRNERTDLVDVRYIAHAMSTRVISLQIWFNESGSAQPNLGAEQVARFRVPLPPLEEQHRIVDVIDRETAEIDAMLADITELRDLLAERRAALIAAAVTGQIDIPTAEEPTHA